MNRNFSEGQAVCFIGERLEKYRHVMPETGTTGRIVLHYEAAGVSLVQWPHGSLASDCDLCRSYMIDTDLVPITEVNNAEHKNQCGRDTRKHSILPG